jgi:hypothetical protein
MAALVGERHAWLSESGGWSHAGWYDATNIWHPIISDARPDDARYIWSRTDKGPGAIPPATSTAPAAAPAGNGGSRFGAAVWLVVSFFSGGLAAYHGAKRNNGSAWQAFKWGFLGSVAPVPVLPLALAQGFAKPRETAEHREPVREPHPKSPFDPFPS